MADMTRDGLIANMARRGIPEHMHDGLAEYILHGREPGHFMSAVLEGDLYEALARADDQNIVSLPAYGMFLWNDAPSGCFGSVQKVADWIDSGGLWGVSR